MSAFEREMRLLGARAKIQQIDVSDFIESIIVPEDGPAEIAAKAFHFFCFVDGKYLAGSRSERIVLEILRFAGNHLGETPGPQSLRDLRKLLDVGASVEQIVLWFRANY